MVDLIKKNCHETRHRVKTERKCPGSQLIIVRAGLGGMMHTEACHQIRQTFVGVLVDVQSSQVLLKSFCVER